MNANEQDADALQGLPLFASVVAHEIRNPLSAVKIALQTVERQARIPTNDALRLRIALREVATIERVLTHVLEWARPVELERQDTTLATLIDRALGEELDRLRIDLRQPAESAHVRVDPTRLADAIGELLRNALDASPARERVTLEMELDTGILRFVVENGGAKLSEEDCRKAFDPFFTKKARGIGLGLPRARNVARAHGGDLTLEPRPAGGARATLTVPLADE